MEETLQVICPNCKSKLTLPKVAGLEAKLLTCPICRFKSNVSVYMQGHLAQGGGGANDEPTQVNFEALGVKDKTIGSLYIGDREFALKKGKTLIGRVASTGHADMQIPTSDRYMSRSHAYITVLNKGNGIVHQLEPANPKNPIKINGKTIERGDVVILKWGDKLTFGHTDLLFERPKYKEEGTIVES